LKTNIECLGDKKVIEIKKIHGLSRTLLKRSPGRYNKRADKKEVTELAKVIDEHVLEAQK